MFVTRGAVDYCVDGVAINIRSMPEAVTSIASAVLRGDGFSVFTLNLDHCNKLRSDPKFRNAYQRARFVTADGFPIVLLGRVHGVPVRRTTGADLLEPLCVEASRCRLPIFLMGPNQSVLRRAVFALRSRVAGLDVAGTYAPGRHFDAHSAEADDAIERIRLSGARICFLAIGAPRQEIFAARCVNEVPGVAFICVGAALDFIAGTQTRAPNVFQTLGLEWLWRLSSSPRRLSGRYLRCAAAMPRLVADAIPQAITARMGRPS